MIHRMIAYRAKREFGTAMCFDGKEKLRIPEVGLDRSPRLLYLHIPFCEKLCPYCSFNRIVFEEDLCRRYFAALRKEIGLYRETGYEFGGVYVGGGTPTVIIEELAETLAFVRQCFDVKEISVETNPNHLTDKNVRHLQDARINRLSVGVQSFDDNLLKRMDRYEKYGSGETIASRLKELKGAFDTVNADMIFNFPSQNLTMLRHDLDILTVIEIDQVTFYPLMISDSTRHKVIATLGNISDRNEKLFYREIMHRLASAYRLSSAWCFSRKGSMIDEYIVDYDEYAGLGSGAIGYLNGICYANTFHVPAYIDQVNRNELPLMATRTFSLRDRIRYDFLMRLFGGFLHVKDLEDKYADSLYKNLWKNLVLFSLIGAIRYTGEDYRLTDRGRYAWVVMMREFFTAVNNFRDFCRTDMPR
ncbi:MAG: coproporphyrinogen III oxidase family protein [Deltaproteobacteria bacterium]|nr:coproporphyrinogen III oxidase family protein [Deltaproteobacteria bacterium]